MVSAIILAVLLSATGIYAQQNPYGQCGGLTWNGEKTCRDGYYCKASDQFYSQCVPGTGPDPPVDPIPTPPVGNAPTTTTTGGTGAATGSGPGTTLQSGYYWIRAVASPNFHKYMQTKPIYIPGTAILDDYKTAGQFQIQSGQLVQLITGGLLYANVDPQADARATMLAVNFKATKNTYGTFMWSGDALQWSHPDIKRQNLSAWLVCNAKSLWINLGAYGYMTPAGCADQTIHYYNDKTAVP